MSAGTLAADHYDRGAHHRPLVVLIHGTLDRAASFARTVRRVDAHDVVAPDRRGYARSLQLGSSDDITRHVADVLALTGGRPTVMIGHSFGGLVGLGAAEAAPGIVRAVGLYEAPTPWLTDDIGDPPGWELRDDPALAAETFFRAVVGDRAWERQHAEFRAARRAEGPAFVADISMANRGLPFDVKNVLQPVTYGLGSAGGARYEASATALIGCLSDAELTTIEGAGHGAHLSHADGFAAWVRAVIATAN